MKRFLLVLIFVPFGLLAQNPGGGTANLQWWLKADVGTLNASSTAATNGQNVARWNDQSAVVNNAVNATVANQPVYQTGIINGYPALLYSGNQYLDGSSAVAISGTTGFDFYVVFKQTSFVGGATNDGAGNFIIDRSSATTALISLKIANTDKYFFQERDDSGSLGGPVSTVSANTSSFVIAHYYRNGLYGLDINGANLATSADNGNLTGQVLRIGRHATLSDGTGGLRGYFTEMVAYNSPLVLASRQKILSYLAIKYGITLDETTLTNYYSSTGSVIYPATTTHSSFINDIAGIGVDTGSGLNQSASQSQNANSLVSISNPSPALTNGNYMMWGNNSISIGNSSNTPPGVTNRLSRVWRASKNTGAGTVTVTFDVTGLGLNLTDPTKYKLLVDDDGNFTNATAQSVTSIVGNIITFNTASIPDTYYFTLASDLVPGPGGVGGSVIWLRADKNAYIDAGTTLATNGQKVQQWNNQGQTSYNVTQATVANQPVFTTNVLNTNPVLRFAAGASDAFMDAGVMGIGSTSSLEYTVVVRPSSTANAGGATDFAGGYILDRSAASPSANPLASLKLITPALFGFQKRTDANTALGSVLTSLPASTVTPQIVEYYRSYASQYGILYNNAIQNTLAESDGPMTLPNLRIGSSRGGAGTGLNGDIAEIVFYSRILSSTERNKVNSYLAVKYGITLNQATLTDYLNSQGTVVYPTTTTHSVYKNEIAGIGQDPVSALVQTSSQSTNANSMVKMQSPSNLDDYEFMIWGDDAGSLAVANTVAVGAPIVRRMTRVWRVAETAGDVGTVTFSIDLTNVPGPKTATDLRLLIDRNGNGFADNDVAPLTGTLAGQIFTVTAPVNFVSGDYFTIGSISNSTPLPIKLLDFAVVNNAGVVDAKWITETEINNEYFTLERSKDGKEFETVTKVNGAGTSTSRLTYTAFDDKPYQGLSYYRLSQTDYDGTISLSAIRSVTVEIGDADALIVYPNPTVGSEFTVQFKSAVSGSALVEIFSLTGQTIYNAVRNDMQAGTNGWSVKPSTILSPGMYLARVNVGGKMYVTKMIVKQQ